MALPSPKAPSSLVKVFRWGFLGLGVFYGMSRQKYLVKKETILREKREIERPAREAAIAAEKERKYKEDMDYLGRQTGVIASNAPALSSSPTIKEEPQKFQSDCGCSY